MHRHRGGPGQDLHLDLRQAIHHINPSFAWKPTLAGAASAVADEFASIPQVFSVNITTGHDNLYAFVVAADQPLLAKLIVETLPAIAGLSRVQSALMIQLFSGTRWRLGGLTPDQVQAVTPEPAKKRSGARI
jgi:hypothetical protein